MTSRHPVPLSRRARSLAVPLLAGLLAFPILSSLPARAAAPAEPSTAKTGAMGRDAALAPCRMRPTNRNTGARGALREVNRTVLGDGARLTNARVSELTITGTDVKVKNVHVDGRILVTGEKVRLRRVTAEHIGISSAVDVVVGKANVGYGAEDGIHITSDGDRFIRDVVLRYNYIHHPQAPPEAHYDGTQVRGVDGLVIRCSTYQSGPFQDTFNANIYLENANGGVYNATIARNWLYGSAWGVMISAESASVVRNRFGGDIHWGYCYGSTSFESHGNIAVPEKRKINLCGQG